MAKVRAAESHGKARVLGPFAGVEVDDARELGQHLLQGFVNILPRLHRARIGFLPFRVEIARFEI